MEKEKCFSLFRIFLCICRVSLSSPSAHFGYFIYVLRLFFFVVCLFWCIFINDSCNFKSIFVLIQPHFAVQNANQKLRITGEKNTKNVVCACNCQVCMHVWIMMFVSFFCPRSHSFARFAFHILAVVRSSFFFKCHHHSSSQVVIIAVVTKMYARKLMN